MLKRGCAKHCALAPVRVSGWSAASWLSLAAGWPFIAGAIASVTTGLLVRKMRDIPDGAQIEVDPVAGLVTVLGVP